MGEDARRLCRAQVGRGLVRIRTSACARTASMMTGLPLWIAADDHDDAGLMRISVPAPPPGLRPARSATPATCWRCAARSGLGLDPALEGAARPCRRKRGSEQHRTGVPQSRFRRGFIPAMNVQVPLAARGIRVIAVHARTSTSTRGARFDRRSAFPCATSSIDAVTPAAPPGCPFSMRSAAAAPAQSLGRVQLDPTRWGTAATCAPPEWSAYPVAAARPDRGLRAPSCAAASPPGA